MIKKNLQYIAATSIILASVSVQADIRRLPPEFLKFDSEIEQAEYNFVIDNIPFVKFKNSDDHKIKKSLNYLYFTAFGEVFNYVPYLFFANNTENLKGFSNESLLFENVLNFNEHYNKYISLKNPLSIRDKSKELVKLINESHTKIDISNIFNFSYYSALEVDKIFPFNINDLSQDITFKFNPNSQEAKLYCDKNGIKFAYVNPISTFSQTMSFDFYTRHTPVFLEIPSEIKEHLTYYNNKDNLPICKYSRTFVDEDLARKYIDSTPINLNKFVLKYDLNKKQPNRSYLNGKVTDLVFTVFDGVGYNYELDKVSGSLYDNYIDIPFDIANLNYEIAIKNKNIVTYNKDQILTGKYSYKINDDFYFKLIDKNQAYIYSTKNRFLGIYDLSFNDKEILLTFKSIIRDYSYEFPLSVKLIRELSNEKYQYLTYLLLNQHYTYNVYETDLQNNFVINNIDLLKIK